MDSSQFNVLNSTTTDTNFTGSNPVKINVKANNFTGSNPFKIRPKPA